MNIHRRIFLLFFLIAPLAAIGQSLSVEYGTRYELPNVKKLPAELIKQLSSHVRPRSYYYSNGRSRYAFEELKSTAVGSYNGRTFNATQKVLKTVYKDFSKQEMIFMDRKNEPKTACIVSMEGFNQWKLLNEKKTILGYECLKAKLINEKGNTVAWYAPEISVMDGPDRFFGLPGLILEVSQGNGMIVTTAQKIKVGGDVSKFLKLPEVNRWISYEEFLRRTKKR